MQTLFFENPIVNLQNYIEKNYLRNIYWSGIIWQSDIIDESFDESPLKA
jgi:hypothetical protein